MVYKFEVRLVRPDIDLDNHPATYYVAGDLFVESGGRRADVRHCFRQLGFCLFPRGQAEGSSSCLGKADHCSASTTSKIEPNSANPCSSLSLFIARAMVMLNWGR